MSVPRAQVWQIEQQPWLPIAAAERFSEYGVWGVSFASGHILAVRRCVASSIGPAHTSVWHRTPDDRWSFYTDVEPELTGSRYFGSALTSSLQTDISLRWTGAWSFVVEVPAAGLRWQVELADSLATRLLSSAFSAIPEAMRWRAPVAEFIGAKAGRMLGAGPLRLAGRGQNGQGFVLIPRRILTVGQTAAEIDGVDLGEASPLPVQVRLGDYFVPQRGLFFIGHSFFERFAPANRAIAALIDARSPQRRIMAKWQTI